LLIIARVHVSIYYLVVNSVFTTLAELLLPALLLLVSV